jgi:hypothetical protein
LSAAGSSFLYGIREKIIFMSIFPYIIDQEIPDVFVIPIDDDVIASNAQLIIRNRLLYIHMTPSLCRCTRNITCVKASLAAFFIEVSKPTERKSKM